MTNEAAAKPAPAEPELADGGTAKQSPQQALDAGEGFD
jgi:hypothetical protein